jgi:16S rRNA (cytosine1402-N4)-methyltransferase
LDRDPAALAAAAEVLVPFGARARLCIHLTPGWRRPRPDLRRWTASCSTWGCPSLQLEDRQRGFAFQAEGPLDMRFDPTAELTAAEIVNTWPLDEAGRHYFSVR